MKANSGHTIYKTLAATRQPSALYIQFDVEVNDDPQEFAERNESLTTVVNGTNVPAVRVMVNLYTPNDSDHGADLTPPSTVNPGRLLFRPIATTNKPGDEASHRSH